MRRRRSKKKAARKEWKECRLSQGDMPEQQRHGRHSTYTHPSYTWRLERADVVVIRVPRRAQWYTACNHEARDVHGLI